jgi:hypothetical protein
MSVTSIRLELERDNGVFYGGEVVRGTVRLTTTGEVKCRGFHFKLVRRLNADVYSVVFRRRRRRRRLEFVT